MDDVVVFMLVEHLRLAKGGSCWAAPHLRGVFAGPQIEPLFPPSRRDWRGEEGWKQEHHENSE